MEQEISKERLDSGELQDSNNDKIAAETAVARAQEKKIALEGQILEKELERSWYTGRFFLQSIGAGFIAVPLVWFYVSNVVVPMLGSENIKQDLEFQLQRRESQQQRDVLKVQNLKLKKVRRSLEEERKTLEQEYKLLEKKKLTVEQANKLLASANSTLEEETRRLERDKDRLKEEKGSLAEAKESIYQEKLQNEKELHAQIVQLNNKSADLTKKLEDALPVEERDALLAEIEAERRRAEAVVRRSDRQLAEHKKALLIMRQESEVESFKETHSAEAVVAITVESLCADGPFSDEFFSGNPEIFYILTAQRTGEPPFELQSIGESDALALESTPGCRRPRQILAPVDYFSIPKIDGSCFVLSGRFWEDDLMEDDFLGDGEEKFCFENGKWSPGLGVREFQIRASGSVLRFSYDVRVY